MRQPHRAQASCFGLPYRPCSAGRSSQASPTRSRVRILVLARRRQAAGGRAQRNGSASAAATAIASATISRPDAGNSSWHRTGALRDPGAAVAAATGRSAAAAGRTARAYRRRRRRRSRVPGPGAAGRAAAGAAAQPDDTVITEMPTQKIENTRGGICRPRQDHGPDHFVRCRRSARPCNSAR